MSTEGALDEEALRELVPAVIGILCSRGADFPAAEDAVQEALLEALSVWSDDPPRDRRGWLVTVAWRKFLDAVRSETARTRREERFAVEQSAAASGSSEDATSADDTLALYFLCSHPDLSAASAIAVTLRAVGGLTTRQIAEAYLVPESTMAQRISRAKRTIADGGLDRPGDLSSVLRVLCLVFNEGHSGDIDLASEAIRLARTLLRMTHHPEASGLLALMLLHHARRASRFDAEGRLIALADQDRSLWDTDLIGEGIMLLGAALTHDQLGESLLRELDEELPRRQAVEAHLRERSGDLHRAAELYTRAADRAGSTAERDHLLRCSARLKGLL